MNQSSFYSEDYSFFPVSKCDFGDFLQETMKFWDFCSEEVAISILKDQQRHALKEKEKRQRDEQYQASKNMSLFPENSIKTKKVETVLQQGRPRMSPVLVFLFLMINGYTGSSCSSKTRDYRLDSIHLSLLLESLGEKMPGETTILENVNILSEETLKLINKQQVFWILKEDLDTFKTLYIDSTSAKANTTWPTDSKLIYQSIEKSYNIAEKLDRFSLSKMNSSKVPQWLSELKKIDFQIAQVNNRVGARAKRKKFYAEFYQVAIKGLSRMSKFWSSALEEIKELDVLPSLAEQAHLALEGISELLQGGLKTMKISIERIENDISTKTKERVLSFADSDAAWIAKGEREPVVGYRPQVVRSGNGFVPLVWVESGNVSDSIAVEPVVKEATKITGITPQRISFDDGYSSADNLEYLEGCNIEDISFSGSKGKKILGDERWESSSLQELRSNRSSVEGVIYTLKHNHNFGHCGRRGLEKVRAEMMGKVFAHNLRQATRIREYKESGQNWRKAA